MAAVAELLAEVVGLDTRTARITGPGRVVAGGVGEHGRGALRLLLQLDLPAVHRPAEGESASDFWPWDSSP